MAQEWTKEIIISDGRRKTYRYRKDLVDMGFRFDKSRGRGSWVLRESCDRYEINSLKRFCRIRKLNICVTDRNMTRSSDYRKTYKDKDRKLRCAYCGKRLDKKNMTVDHIIPVSRFRGNRSKAWLNLLHIRNINEPANLAPACRRCNTKKGSKGGLWIIRGFLGKNYYIRTAMNITRTLVIVAIVILLMKMMTDLQQSDTLHRLTEFTLY